ncbi:hypothetical protein Tco_1298034, partial [Tanacetum coccineum]
FLDNKWDEGEFTRHSIDKGPYKRKEITDSNDDTKTIIEPINKLSQKNQNQYYADIKVINYILQGIPNDIYNSVDACKDAQTMWNKIKRLMQEQHFDVLYDYMSQFEPHVKASKTKKAARNHDPLALVANSHASLSYSHSPQPYYVIHPSSMIDNDDDYQGEIQGDAQEDKLSTAMMLLSRAITQRYSTPTNNRLRTSSSTRNQAVIQDGRSIDEYEQYVQRVPRTESTPGKTNMLLATKDEARVHLDEEENDFLLDNAYGDNALEELNAAVVMMARIQPTDDKSDVEPTYDDEFISEVNASQIDMINGILSKSGHEQRHHEKLETIIHTYVDDQIDSDIIFDDSYVGNNSGKAKHDTNVHDQPFHDFESMIQNVQIEAKINAK